MSANARNFVDVHGLALAFQCSERQIQLLTIQGMPKAGRGKYDLAACRVWYRQRQAQKPLKWGSINNLVRGMRRRLRSVPFAVAPKLVGKSQPEILRLLRGAINEAITALPSGNVAREGEM